MHNLIKILILFLALTGAAALLGDAFNVDFGSDNFWDNHGIIFLFFITLFPRLTLLFSSIPFGGLLWWLGFIFAPRFLVACLATLAYWNQNPILVIIAWLVCLSGESGEKYMVTERVKVYRGTSPDIKVKGESIEAEYRELK